MILGEVVGTVVATERDHGLGGHKMLVVQPVDILSFQPAGSCLVALDVVGAGNGEIVMVVGGSSARLAEGFENRVPTDSTITAIIDSVEVMRKSVYEKSSSEAAGS
jgi:ethanolamine utilization protein EutN